MADLSFKAVFAFPTTAITPDCIYFQYDPVAGGDMDIGVSNKAGTQILTMIKIPGPLGPQGFRGMVGESVDFKTVSIPVDAGPNQAVFVAPDAVNLVSATALLVFSTATSGGGIITNYTITAGNSITLASGIDDGSLVLFVGQTPAITALEIVQDYVAQLIEQTNESSFEVADGQGNKALEVSKAGVTMAGNLVAKKMSVAGNLKVETVNSIRTETVESPYLLEFADKNDRLLFAINKRGAIIVRQIAAFIAEVNGIPDYGQSNSLNPGSNTTVHGTPDEPSVIMMKKGTQTGSLIYEYDYDGTAVYDDVFIPQYETGDESNSATTGRAIKQFILQENGFDANTGDFKILVGGLGQSGVGIDNFTKGSINYRRLINWATNAKRIADLQGKRFYLPALNFTHGETSRWDGVSPSTYATKIEELRVNLSADIRAITGQPFDIIFNLYQFSNQGERQVAGETLERKYGIVQAVRDLAINYPDKYILAGPTYQFPYSSDSVHFSTEGHIRMSAMNAYAVKKKCFDKEDWLPLHIKEHSVFANRIYLSYHVPVGGLVFESSAVTDPGNKGYKLYDATGTEKVIAAVEIINPKMVKVTAALGIAAGDRLTYAQNNHQVGLYNVPPNNVNSLPSSGPTTGSRGCLRDRQGDTVLFETYLLHNYAVTESIKL